MPELKTTEKIRLLLVEDEPLVAETFMGCLGSVCDVEWRKTFAMGLGAADTSPVPFDFVILDLDLPDSGKEQTMRRIAELASAAQCDVIVFTGVGDGGEDIKKCIQFGAVWFYPKQLVSTGYAGLLCVLENLRVKNIYGTA